ncbi:MAG TPA: helix-turn-helix domain-containing protein [Terracidiphilus sp.]|jgi:hypothetical protein
MQKPGAMARARGRAIKMPVEPEYLSVNECEIVSGLSRWTWRRYAYAGTVASVKVGPRLLIPRSEMDRIMRAGLRPALNESAARVAAQ